MNMLRIVNAFCLRNIAKKNVCISHACISYTQGQTSGKDTREYFYYIDHQGQLFLDDVKLKNFITCFKDKKFLAFFFKRLRINKTETYQEFPYISLCGPERNYIRCDDVPIVYDTLIEKTTAENTEYFLSYGHTGGVLAVPFEPETLCMLPDSGRVYHIAQERSGGIGLVKSKLAIELSQFFGYKAKDNSEITLPTSFNWKGKEYTLNNKLLNHPRL